MEFRAYRHRRSGIGARHRHIGLAACCCVLLGLPFQASAAGTATLSTNRGVKMTVEWQDSSTARFNLGGPNGYALLQKGKVYVVTPDGRVMSADFMKNMGIIDKPTPSGTQQAQNGKPTLKGPLADETVAGIPGKLYWVTVDGRTTDVVLTDDPLVKELTQVWIAYAAAMTTNPMMTPNAMREVFHDKGELRAGTDFKLVSINGTTPPAADFVLPDNAQSDQSAGLMGTLMNTFTHAKQLKNDHMDQKTKQPDNAQSDQSAGLMGTLMNTFMQAKQLKNDHMDQKTKLQKLNAIVNSGVKGLLKNIPGN